MGVFGACLIGLARAEPVPEPSAIFTLLRDQVLNLSPAEAGLTPSEELPRVWGLLMETGYPEAVATLVALTDGTVSLYFGDGGGILGGGQHAAVRDAAHAWLASAERSMEQLSPAQGYPLPEVGRVRFYILTFSGALTADASADELGQTRHALSPLFFAGHNVITEVRRMESEQDDHAEGS